MTFRSSLMKSVFLALMLAFCTANASWAFTSTTHALVITLGGGTPASALGASTAVVDGSGNNLRAFATVADALSIVPTLETIYVTVHGAGGDVTPSAAGTTVKGLQWATSNTWALSGTSPYTVSYDDPISGTTPTVSTSAELEALKVYLPSGALFNSHTRPQLSSVLTNTNGAGRSLTIEGLYFSGTSLYDDTAGTVFLNGCKFAFANFIAVNGKRVNITSKKLESESRVVVGCDNGGLGTSVSLDGSSIYSGLEIDNSDGAGANVEVTLSGFNYFVDGFPNGITVKATAGPVTLTGTVFRVGKNVSIGDATSNGVVNVNLEASSPGTSSITDLSAISGGATDVSITGFKISNVALTTEQGDLSATLTSNTIAANKGVVATLAANTGKIKKLHIKSNTFTAGAADSILLTGESADLSGANQGTIEDVVIDGNTFTGDLPEAKYAFQTRMGASTTDGLNAGNFVGSVSSAVSFINNIMNALTADGASFDANDLVAGVGKTAGTAAVATLFGAGDTFKAHTTGNTWPENSFSLTDNTYGVYTTPPNPTVTSVDPATTSTNVSRNKTIAISFDKEMSSASLDTAFSLSPISSSQYTKSLNAAKTVLSITPKTSWASSTKYTIEVSKDAESAAGNKLRAALSSTFTTEAKPASEAAANAGGAASIVEVEATLGKAGLSSAAIAFMASTDGIVLLPSALGQTGSKGAASGSSTDVAAAVAEAESAALVVPSGQKNENFVAADAVGTVNGLKATFAGSTSSNPKIAALYTEGYLPDGLTTFPKIFKYNTNTVELLEFSYVAALTSEKIKAATTSGGGWCLINPATGAVIPNTTALPALAGGYELALFIKDNSGFDMDSALGVVLDPSILTSGTSSSSSAGSSSSSGCMMNPTAGFGLEWLMLIIAPFIMAARSRFRK